MSIASQKTVTVGGGRYKIQRLLGTGMFGEVHLATDLDEGGDVAVKLFHNGVVLNSALVEAQFQRRLSSHPRVVPLRNVDVRTGGGPIIVTEYFPGGSVAGRTGSGAAGLLLGLRWTCDVCDALVHAHALGIFHRDAKPSNLLLDEADHASLCDFGVAEDSFVGLAAGGGMVYSALAAPELGRTGTTNQTEVWMVGVLLYRLLLGKYPYPTGAVGVLTPVQPQNDDPQLPRALATIMQRALSADPSRRYPDVAALRRDLIAVSVVTEFSVVSAGGAIQRWEAPIAAGTGIVEVVSSPNSTFTARLRIDRGFGPRTVNARPRRSSQTQALRDARTMLHGVVEGRLP
jgi:serine/threonine protein kinase